MAEGSDLSNERGQAFEAIIGRLLNILQATHPTVVTVKRQPKIVLYNDEEVFPDFEFVCALPHQTDIRLIECQDRNKDSQEIQRKIRHIKSLSRHNRFFVVYRDPNYLGPAVRGTLAKDGVPTYDLLEFLDFLRRLEAVIKSSEQSSSGVTEVEEAIQSLQRSLFPAELGVALGTREKAEFLPRLLDEVGKDILVDQMASRLTSLASERRGKDEGMVGEAKPEFKPPWRPW